MKVLFIRMPRKTQVLQPTNPQGLRYKRLKVGLVSLDTERSPLPLGLGVCYVATIPFHEGIRRTLAWFQADDSRMRVPSEDDAQIERILAAYRAK